MEEDTYTLQQAADLLSVGKQIIEKWVKKGIISPVSKDKLGRDLFLFDDFKKFDSSGNLAYSKTPTPDIPKKQYSVLELFAGAGGMALGLESAGLKCTLLNEIDKHACETLRRNRPHWNVVEGDVRSLDFTQYKNQIDIVTGGFPCQAFSYAGKKLGFEDARGTLFFEFARAVKETQPLICVGENVRGLLKHEGGKTIDGMISVLDELGYNVLPPQILKAIFYNVPQKRERLIIVGLRKDKLLNFKFPTPHKRLYTLKDALKAGRLFSTDVPASDGQKYPKRKAEILAKVPPGGYWRDLPEDLQREYMQGSFFLGGGKTGMARRMSWDEPCLTLTCAPAQKQTERCHPDENRPFTVREYARIQTFPDCWKFAGSQTQQYKQIGNAVPVNLAKEIGSALVKTLNEHYFPIESNQERRVYEKDGFELKARQLSLV